MQLTRVVVAFGLSTAFLAAQIRPSSEQQIEPDARLWQTWVLTSASEQRPGPPPDRPETIRELLVVRDALANPAATAAQQLAYWNAGSPNYRWQQIAMANTGLTSFPGFRALALMNVAIADAEIAAWDAKYYYNRLRPSQADRSLVTRIPTPDSPSYPSEHAAAAGAAAAVLSYLFPGNAQAFSDMAEQAGNSFVYAGVQYPSDVSAGLALGQAVAAGVIERAQHDGSDEPWAGSVPTGPGKWIGTNPVLPQMANWQTWVLSNGSQLRPAPPPDYNSAQMAEQVAQVKNFARTTASNTAVYRWASAFVYKLWGDILDQKLFEYGLTANPPRAARAYALSSVAQYDALIACWDSKYTFWEQRPIQLDPTITTVIPTPNFPGYVAAHATLSEASATILGYLFPQDATYFNAQAQEAASSRVWGGIHLPVDIEAGLQLGNEVAALVVKRAKGDGSR
jgi:membrane-associated phospholipid phosphatase